MQLIPESGLDEFGYVSELRVVGHRECGDEICHGSLLYSGLVILYYRNSG
jgi:hypothetical protein